MSYDYIAQPYTHKSPAMQDYRFRKAERVVAGMLRAGRHVYSPIVHTHELAKHHDLPTTFDFWRSYNFAMLRSARSLVVLMLPGWQESVGLQAEIDFALTAGIPIEWLDPAKEEAA